MTPEPTAIGKAPSACSEVARRRAVSALAFTRGWPSRITGPAIASPSASSSDATRAPAAAQVWSSATMR